MSKGRQFRERLEYQLRFFVDRRRFPYRDAADRAAADAKRHFIATGKSIPGVRIEARFRNPDRRSKWAARWKSSDDPGQSLSAFWTSIVKRVYR